MAELHFGEGSHFVLDVKVHSRIAPPKITVVVDGDNGISIDDCAALSQAISDSIHESNLLEDYNLEVTTPGVDQPLKLMRQYQKHIGRNLKVEMKEKEIIRGKLLLLEGGEITLEEEGKQKGKAEKKIRKIPFEQIEKTFVMISFK